MDRLSPAEAPLTFGEAAAAVARETEKLTPARPEPEPVDLLDAQGRVLAEPVVADRDQPPFARSTRDGFAARARNWAVGGPLEVVGLLRAGEPWSAGEVPAGACVEIMTGAPVPPGADSVVMLEHVSRDGTQVRLVPERAAGAGDNIVPAGAEARAGATLLPAGSRLHAHGVAVAAACGYARVRVYGRPRVAILATGDELVEIGDTPLPYQIRNSNTYTLAAQVRALRATPLLRAPVADQAEALQAAIREAVAGCDLLLLSGGVSMGKYDLVEPALGALGGRFHFTGARIQPGKPIVFGSMEGGLPFFGLPGNPVSTIVCFALFVAPLLAWLGGERGYRPPFVQARLETRVRGKAGLTRFLPARLTHDVAGSSVAALAWQGSGDLASTAQANCFLVAPERGEDLLPGDPATVLLA